MLPGSNAEELLALLTEPLPGLWLAGLWGALWGSFFNLAAGRIGAAASEDDSERWLDAARAGLASLRQLVHPPSACPRCGHAIRGYDNVPILGWLWLRGRCRDCQQPIAIRYPLVELLSTLLALAVFHRFVTSEPAPPSLQLARFLIYFFFIGTLLVLTLIDLATMLLPLAITLPAIPLFFLAGRALPDVSTSDALIGLAAGFGLLWLLRNGYALATGREGLGGGDELLLGLVGGLLGWRALPVTLFAGAMIGTLVTLPRLALARRRAAAHGEAAAPALVLRHVEVPFGPFLALGAAIYLFAGRAIWIAFTDYADRG